MSKLTTQSIPNEFWFESIKESFKKLGKNIDHLTNEEMEVKCKITDEKTKVMKLDVNDGKEYLKVVYEVFGV